MNIKIKLHRDNKGQPGEEIPICPHCGHEITRSEAASIMRKLPSEKRTQASRTNGLAPVKPGNAPRGRPKGSKNKNQVITVVDTTGFEKGKTLKIGEEYVKIVKN